MSEFKKIVERSAQDSQRQVSQRLGGYAETRYQGRGVTIHAGDVINLPYPAGELSTIEAIGQAWVTASGTL